MQNLFKLFFLSMLLWGFQARAQKLHLMVVADVADQEVGKAIQQSLRQITHKVENIARQIDFRLKTHLLTKERFSKAGVKRAIANLSSSSQDIVFFYFIGHGFRYPGQIDNYPVLLLGKAKQDNPKQVGLRFRQVVTLLKTKKARLRIIVAEACNATKLAGTLSVNIAQDGFKSLGTYGYGIQANYQRMFLAAKGDIVVTSCDKGQYSWVDDNHGGLFCKALFNSIEKQLTDMNAVTSDNMWLNALQDTRKLTSELAMRSRGQKQQQPQYNINLANTRSLGAQSHTPSKGEEALKKAIEYWRKAAAKGDKTALERLKKYAQDGND